MAKRVSSKSGVSLIIIVLIVVGVLGVWSFFTRGGTEAPSVFMVKYGTRLISSSAELELPLRKVRFDVLTLNNGTYKVAVLPVKQSDFEYTVDGEIYSFTGNEYTECFDLSLYDGYFTLDLTYANVEKMFKSLYHGKTVVLPELSQEKTYFELRVTSGSSSVSLFIRFNSVKAVEEIILPERVVL